MWKGPYGNWGSRKYLLASLDQSLERLGLEYVDIFYHHRMDPDTPLEETMGALDQAVKSGKALYAGISNYDGKTMKRAAAILRELHCPFVINQSLQRMGLPYVDIFYHHRMDSNTPLEETMSALAQGMLTDRYLHGIPKDSRMLTDGRFLKKEQLTETKLQQIQALNAIAEQRGESLAQMALKWVLKDDVVTSVLIGASKPEQILDNIKVIDSADFSEEELQKIDEIVNL